MDEIKLRLGRNVRRHRKAKDLSQEQLAEKVSMSETSIGLLERGRVWPEFENLTGIAKALGTSSEELLNPESDDLVPKSKLAEISTRLEVAEKRADALKEALQNVMSDRERQILAVFRDQSDDRLDALARLAAFDDEHFTAMKRKITLVERTVADDGGSLESSPKKNKNGF